MPRKQTTPKTHGRGTIAAFVTNMLLRTKKPYAEIAANARRKFDGAETSPASVRHYASRMRRQKMNVPDRPVTREASFTA